MVTYVPALAAYDCIVDGYVRPCIGSDREPQTPRPAPTRELHVESRSCFDAGGRDTGAGADAISRWMHEGMLARKLAAVV
jgi:hypothetical protein